MDAGRILFRPRSFERPELSLPLLAQKRINVDRDLRIVVVNGKTWEAHWRVCEKGWKANIDGGGAGIWSQVPEDVLESSEQLAADLETQWLAVDVLYDDGQFHITEFSPVWHHYRINEKANFSYREDYNIDTPVDEGHDFEGMIIRTLFFPQGMPQPD